MYIHIYIYIYTMSLRAWGLAEERESTVAINDNSC